MVPFTKLFFTKLTPHKVYLYSVIIGCVTGLLSSLFYYLLFWATHYNYQYLFGILLPHPAGDPELFQPYTQIIERRWLFFIIPALGGLAVGIICHFFSPEASGTGMESYLDAFHNREGAVKKRGSFFKAITTILTLSTGGSTGKEGPTAQIGSGIGSMVGYFIKSGPKARRTFLLAGAAGGLGAIFKAPLGGAITAVEVLYREDIESEALIPCIISSITAYTIFCSFFGFQHIFNIHAQIVHSVTAMVLYAILGIICSLMGYVYVKFFHTCGDFFHHLKMPLYLKPALGGFLIGCVGYFLPEITGESLGLIQSVLNGSFNPDGFIGLRIFLTLAVWKIITNSITIGSGGSGGIFGPSLFIGGMLGAAIGSVAKIYFPESIPDITPFVIVGMGSFFAGIANAPIASMIMVSEMTGGYEFIPPLMLVSVISLILSHRWSIYKNQVKNKFYSNAHQWDLHTLQNDPDSLINNSQGTT